MRRLPRCSFVLRKSILTLAMFLVPWLANTCPCLQAAAPLRIEWERSLAPPSRTEVSAISVVPSGDIFVTGSTQANLAGDSFGSEDGFVVSLSSAGNLNWTSQYGSSEFDSALAVDSNSFGESFSVGRTFGDIGSSNAGKTDGYVVKFDSSGQPSWSAQIGSTEIDSVQAVAASPDGGALVTGQTSGTLERPTSGDRDAFVSRYDDSGNQLWLSQYGGSGFERAEAIAIDAIGNSFTAGVKMANGFKLDTQDAFLAKHDVDGDFAWMVSLASNLRDQANAVAIDSSGDIYITGTTKGVLAPGGSGGGDAFLAKYDTAGQHLWTTQYGGPLNEVAVDIAADQSGNVYIAGRILDNPDDGPVGDADPFIVAYSRDGELLWDFTILDPLLTQIYTGIDLDAAGNIYTADVRRPASSFSIGEPFVTKFAIIPDPSTEFLEADYNSNGVVDAADYGVWLANLGSTDLAAWSPGDGTGDGNVTIEDYHTWWGQLGMSLDDIAESSHAVPEPATAVLLLIAVHAVVAYHRSPR